MQNARPLFCELLTLYLVNPLDGPDTCPNPAGCRFKRHRKLSAPRRIRSIATGTGLKIVRDYRSKCCSRSKPLQTLGVDTHERWPTATSHSSRCTDLSAGRSMCRRASAMIRNPDETFSLSLDHHRTGLALIAAQIENRLAVHTIVAWNVWHGRSTVVNR